MNHSYFNSLLGERENVILAARRHWLFLARNILLEGFTILLIFILVIATAIYFTPAVWWVALFGFFILMIPLLSMTRDILEWSNRLYVVTNRRVMQLSGVLNKEVTDSSLEKVNDVKMSQSALARWFDYGDIEILTASELGINTIKQINAPIRFKTAMLNAKEKLGDIDHDFVRQPAPPAEAGDFVSLLEQLDALRRNGLLTEAEYQEKRARVLEKLG
jgi:uncharacterized membrane protein YdbT with pleckstrin-like domain